MTTNPLYMGISNGLDGAAREKGVRNTRKKLGVANEEDSVNAMGFDADLSK